ncbi:NAD-dependent epimerase/dehydratase family protein [Aeromonas veronii]|uniref:NAD-dependent epimerase/dehydratase family protein n=1 Tax=Aeromonas veronii TaxID=654 RepID=UPI003F67698C
MNILLTGSTGFVGKELLKSAFIYRRVMRGRDNNSNNHSSSEYYIEELNSSTTWDGAFDNVDCIIHLAALAHNESYTLSDYNEVNVRGTLHLANEAFKSGVKRFVFVSSIGVNGRSTKNNPFTSNDISKPQSAYAQSKYDAELGLKKISEKTGRELVIIRPTLVYGSNAPGKFGMLTKLVKISPILPFGLASNRRDFISVENLSDLLITCAIHPNAAGHTFLASDGNTVSIKEFTNEIAKGLGKKVIQLPVPISFMRFIGKIIGKSVLIDQLLGNLEVDSSNLEEILDWTPPFTMIQSMANLRGFGKE